MARSLHKYMDDDALALISWLIPSLAGASPSDTDKLEPSDKRYGQRYGQGRAIRADSCASTGCDSDSVASWAGASEPEEESAGRVQQADLDIAFAEVGNMRQWDEALWDVERVLSAACGGRGRVACMRSREVQNLESDGSFAKVVVVKSVPLRWLTKSPEEFQRVHGKDIIELPWQDICITRHLNKAGYPYACKLLDIFAGGGKAHIMTSLASEGDLHAWCSKTAPAVGAEREVAMRPLVKKMCMAVRCLHDLGIAHRDLSLENILLADCGGPTLEVKLIDFGMATIVPEKCQGARGKRPYQAPEMHEVGSYNAFVTDAFAIGVVMFAMAFGKYPWTSTKPNRCANFEALEEHGFAELLRLDAFADVAEVLSEAFKSFMTGLLRPRARARSTLGETFSDAAAISAPRRICVFDSNWLNRDGAEGIEGGKVVTTSVSI